MSRLKSACNPALTRRRFLGLGAAAAAAAVLPYRISSAAYARIGILGGGVAGLSAAYWLKQHAVPFEIIEASTRVGGRLFTVQPWNTANQFIELGGELLNSNDDETLWLARRLRREQTFAIRAGRRFKVEDLKILKFADGEPDPSLTDSLYLTRGQVYTQKELEAGLGNILPVVAELKRELFGLYEGDYTYHLAGQFPKAAEWDRKTLTELLDSLKPHADKWVLETLKGAFEAECGLRADQLSAMNLITIVDTDLSDGFFAFGEHDETMRLGGGNSALVRALLNSLSNYGSKPFDQMITRGQSVTAIRRQGSDFRVHFNSGPAKSYTHLIVAVPLTQLRNIDGWKDLNLSAPKINLIQDMAMGQNSKVMTEFSERAWRNRRLAGKRACQGGFFLSDFAGALWETSRLQPGGTGILTNYRDGALPSFALEYQTLQTLRDAFGAGVAETFTGRVASFDWPTHVHTKGSFSTLKPGNSSSCLGAGAEPECEGKLLFAGEHTSVKSQGFINGGVESGLRAAKQAVRSVANQA